MKWLVFLFASAFSLICEESCIKSCKEEKEIYRCFSDCGCVEEEISLDIEYVDLAFVMQKIPLEFNDIVWNLTGCNLYCEEPCWKLENKSDILQCLKDCNCFELIGIEKVSDRKKQKLLDEKEIEKDNKNEEVDIGEIENDINTEDCNDTDICMIYNFTEKIEDKIEKNYEDNEQKESEIENSQNDLRFNISNTSLIGEENENRTQIEQDKEEDDVENWDISTSDYNFTKIFESLIKNLTAGMFDENNEETAKILNEDSNNVEFDSENITDASTNLTIVNTPDWSKNSSEYTELIQPSNNSTELPTFTENPAETNDIENGIRKDIYLNPDESLENPIFSDNIEAQDLLQNRTNNILSNSTKEESSEFENNPDEEENLEFEQNKISILIQNKTQDSENFDEGLSIEDKERNSENLAEELLEDDINKPQEISSETSTEELSMEENFQINDSPLQANISYENTTINTLDINIEKTIENNKESSIISDFLSQVTSNDTLLNNSSIEVNKNIAQASQDSTIFNISKSQDSTEPNTNENEAVANEGDKNGIIIDINRTTAYYDAAKLSEIWGEAETYGENTKENIVINNTKIEENATNPEPLLENSKDQIGILEEQIEKPSENIEKAEEESIEENKNIEKSTENQDDSYLNSQKDFHKNETYEISSGAMSIEGENKKEEYEEEEDSKKIENSQEVELEKDNSKSLDNEAPKNPEINLEEEIKKQDSNTTFEDAKIISSSQEINLIENSSKSSDNELLKNSALDIQREHNQESIESNSEENSSKISENELPKNLTPDIQAEHKQENIESNSEENSSKSPENESNKNSRPNTQTEHKQESNESDSEENSNKGLDNESFKNSVADIKTEQKQDSTESNSEDKSTSYNKQDTNLIENSSKIPDNQAPKNSESSPQSNSVNPSSTKVSIGPSNCMVQCSQMCKKQEVELKCLEDCLTTFCKTFEENSSWSTWLVIAGNGFSLMFVVYCIWKFIKRKRNYDDDDSMFTPRYYNISN